MFTVAWLYIEPTQDGMSQPAGDPVDSDHFVRSPLQATDGLIQ